MTRTSKSCRAAAPGAALLGTLLALAAPCVARAHAADLQRWQGVLQSYVADPNANRGALLALGRSGTDGLPAPYRVALADAHLRAGHLRTAGRLFDDLLASDPGEPWEGFAALGRGWTAARRGDLETARASFDRASTASGETGLLGDLMTGMLDAADGSGDRASGRFAHIVDNPDASESLRVAAMMADGYGRFWMGDDAGARAAFERVSARAPAGAVADDARYAAALAQWRQGDRAGAEEALSKLSAESRRRHDRSSAGMANLVPRSLFRAGARRYRRMPLGLPSDQLLGTLDLDGPSIARVSLRRLKAGGKPPEPLGHLEHVRHDAGGSAPAQRPIASPANAADTRTPEPTLPYVRIAATLALLIGAFALWLTRASQPHQVR